MLIIGVKFMYAWRVQFVFYMDVSSRWWIVGLWPKSIWKFILLFFVLSSAYIRKGCFVLDSTFLWIASVIKSLYPSQGCSLHKGEPRKILCVLSFLSLFHFTANSTYDILFICCCCSCLLCVTFITVTTSKVIGFTFQIWFSKINNCYL